MNYKNIIKYTFYILVFTQISNSFAFPKTKSDFSFLPQYCLAQMKPEWSPKGIPERWKKTIPGTFPHLHHYCAALHYLRLARNKTQKTKREEMLRQNLLRGVYNNTQYMIKHSPHSDPLFPYIYTTQAEAYLESGEIGNAITYFNKAINANKKFTKPYALLADYYIKSNNKKSAREILEEGLKYSPNSNALNSRMKKLSNN